MIRLLENDRLDRSRWDQTVRTSCFPSVYGLSWFLDRVSPGWQGMIVDDYRAVFPLPVRRKFGIHYLAQPPFTQQLGVFSEEPVSPDLMRTLILHVKSRIPFADIQLNESNRVKGNGFSVIERRNLLLAINRPYAEIQQGFSKQVLRNLARFRGSGLEVVSDNTSFPMVIDTFRKNQGRKYRGIKPKDYEMLEELCREFLRRELLDVRLVRNRLGNVVAGALFVRSFKRSVFYFSTNSTEGYAVSAMTAIIDDFLRENAGKEMTIDFEGSETPGLSRFYKSFGSREVIYPRIVYNRLRWPVRLFKPS